MTEISSIWWWRDEDIVFHFSIAVEDDEGDDDYDGAG